MNYWLMKSEPQKFSLQDLQARPQQTEPWDGVRNYQARNYLRQMAVGDLAFFYHSNSKPSGIAGIMKIVRAAYPDDTQFDPQSYKYDPRSRSERPIWDLVDVQLVCAFTVLLPLAALRAEPALAEMMLLRKGNRLSITPVQAAEWETIVAMAGQADDRSRD